MRYDRNADKAETRFAIMESIREEETLPREVELCLHKYCPFPVLGGQLDVLLREAEQHYLIRGGQCYKLDSAEANEILEDEERTDELLRRVRSSHTGGPTGVLFNQDGSPSSFDYIDELADEEF